MRTEEITKWTGVLVKSLGRPRDPIPEDSLKALHAASDFNGMLRLIREQLRLDVRLRVGYVNSGGIEKAPAWIQFPDPMPLYGTQAFRDLKLTVFIRKKFLMEAPYGTIACAMSHELSHVVLHSIRHEFRWTEEAVDLTAMILGFREMFLRDSSYDTVREIHNPEHGTGLGSWLSRLLRPGGEIDLEFGSHELGYLTHEEREYAAWILRNWP